jgi:hemerythrin
MSLLTWSKKYSVGLQAWDQEHTILFGILNDFHAAMLAGKAQSAAEPLLRKMVDYTQTHFAHEEAMMAAAHHPRLAQHRAQHEALTAKVMEFTGRSRTDDTNLYISLLRFLRDWLDRHIVQEDRDCAAWLIEHDGHWNKPQRGTR